VKALIFAKHVDGEIQTVLIVFGRVVRGIGYFEIFDGISLNWGSVRMCAKVRVEQAHSIPHRIEIGGKHSLTTKIALLIQNTIVFHDFEQDAEVFIHDVGLVLGLGESFFVNGRKIMMMIPMLDMLGTEIHHDSID
jgi:hypothetical protein